MIPHMRIIGYDDWFGLYVDKKLVYEGHRIDPFHIVQAAEGNPCTLEQIEVDEETIQSFFEEWGHLPYDYNDIPQEVFA